MSFFRRRVVGIARLGASTPQEASRGGRDSAQWNEAGIVLERSSSRGVVKVFCWGCRLCPEVQTHKPSSPGRCRDPCPSPLSRLCAKQSTTQICRAILLAFALNAHDSSLFFASGQEHEEQKARPEPIISSCEEHVRRHTYFVPPSKAVHL